MLTGIRSQIVGPAAVAASNGTGRVVSTAVSVEPRGELAGGPGETGPINQALHPRKLTVKEPRRTTEPRIQSSRWSWLTRPWRTQGRRVQQSSSSNKSTPSRGRPKSLTKEPPTHRCLKSSLFVGNVSSWSSRLQGPRMKNRISARRRQRRWSRLKTRNPDMSNFTWNWPKSSLRWPMLVWPSSRKVSRPRRHNSFLRIETHLHKLSERQKGESGVSELLAAANAATQALADKLASVVPAVDLAGGTEGNDAKPMDTNDGTRDASSKRTATDLDEAQASEQLEKWATSVGFDITLLDDDVRVQALRDLCQLGKRTRTT